MIVARNACSRNYGLLMEIQGFTEGLLATNVFLLTNQASEEALVIDCPDGSFETIMRIVEKRGLKVKAALVTHGHYDHTADLAKFQRNKALVHAHPKDQFLIERPEMMEMLMPPGMHVEPARIDVPLQHGQRLTWWDQEIEARHVPGHCPGSLLFYFPAVKAAFVGDAIFAGSIGRYDFPGGSFAELERSIREQIYTLPDETVLYPGHGPATTVGAEKRGNPFVRP